MMPAKSKPKAKRGNSQIGLADYPAPVAASPSRSRKEAAAAQRRYAAEDALRTLTRAEEHRGDSRLMGDVKRLAAEQASKMARIAKR